MHRLSLVAAVALAACQQLTVIDLQLQYDPQVREATVRGEVAGSEAFTPARYALPEAPTERPNVAIIVTSDRAGEALMLFVDGFDRSGTRVASATVSTTIRAGQTTPLIATLITGAICGDGRLEPPETCDDGNRVSGDGCNSNCTNESTRDGGVTDAGSDSTCGDGVIQPTEACDDGNRQPGDGCNADCIVEPSRVCVGQPSRCYFDDEVSIADRDRCPASGAEGSPDRPYCRVGDALASGLATIIVRSGTYNEAVNIDRAVSIIGDPGVIIDGADGVAVTLSMSARATLRGLQLVSNRTALSAAGDTKPTIVSCTLGPSGGFGADIKGSSQLVLTRSVVKDNPSGGLRLDSTAPFRVQNNIIVRNGSPTSDQGGVRLEEVPVGSSFANNTIVDNRASGDSNERAGLRCDRDADIVSSIIWGNTSATAAEPVSDRCSVRFSNIGPNVAVDPLIYGEDPALTADHHLTAASPCVDRGDPDGTELTGGTAPVDDIDGDIRGGDRIDCGADERR